MWTRKRFDGYVEQKKTSPMASRDGGILKVDCSASIEKSSPHQDKTTQDGNICGQLVLQGVRAFSFKTTKINISSTFCVSCASGVCDCVLFKIEIISARQRVQLKHAIAIVLVCALCFDQSTRWFFLKCIISSALRSLPSG